MSPQKIQLVTVGEELLLTIPPYELPEKVQLVTVGEELTLTIPPPASWAALFENEQLETVGEESESLYIPPPRPSPKSFLAEFPENVQFVTTGDAD